MDMDSTSPQDFLEDISENIDYSVIGPRDSRIHIINTTQFPYNTICYLERYFGNGYYCPVCHNWYAVIEDDSFLKAVVSEKQVENVRHIGEVLEEL